MSKSFEDIIKPLETHLSKDEYDVLCKLSIEEWVIDKKTDKGNFWKKIDNATRATKLRKKLLSLIKDEEGTAETDDAIYEAIQQIVHEYPQNNNKRREDDCTKMECPIEVDGEHGDIILTDNPAVRPEAYAYSCVSGNIYHKSALIAWLTRNNTDPVNRAPYSPFELRKLGYTPAVSQRMATVPTRAERVRAAETDVFFRFVWGIIHTVVLLLFCRLMLDFLDRYEGDTGNNVTPAKWAVAILLNVGAIPWGLLMMTVLGMINHQKTAMLSTATLYGSTAVLMYGSFGWSMGNLINDHDGNAEAALSAEIITSVALGLYAAYFMHRMIRSAWAANPAADSYNPAQELTARQHRSQAIFSLAMPAFCYGVVKLVGVAVDEAAVLFTGIAIALSLVRHAADPAQREVLRFSNPVQVNARPRTELREPLLQRPQ